jgi:hypothetical protein
MSERLSKPDALDIGEYVFSTGRKPSEMRKELRLHILKRI